MLHPTSQAGSRKINGFSRVVNIMFSICSAKPYLSRKIPMAANPAVGFSVVALVVLGGCAKPEAPTNYITPTDEVSRADIDDLGNRITAVSNRLTKRISEDNVIAYLTPADTGYTPLDTPIGTITVQIIAVEAFADGSRVTLKIGNPLGARLGSFKADLEYGPLDKDQYPIDDQRRTTTQQTINLDAPAGTWHEIKLALPGVPPSKLSYMTISSVQSVTLAMPIE